MAGPAAQASFSRAPPLPRMSILSSAPVMASKPIAKTMASTSYSRTAVFTPAGVIRSIGSSVRSTRLTLSRLKVA